MKAKSLVALALAAVAAAAGAVYFTVIDASRSASDPTLGQALYPGLAGKLNDVASVSLARRDGVLTLRRTEQGWRLAEKGSYPVPFDRVRKLLVDIAELRTLEAKTSSAAVYASLDVDDLNAPEAKSVVVTLQDPSGAPVASLVVGKSRLGRGGPASDGTYVRKAGEAQAWLVRGRLALDREPERWLERRLVDIGRERVRDATIVQPDGAKLVVRRDKPADSDFLIADPPADRTAKAAFERNSVGGAWEALDLDDVRPAGELKFAAEGPYSELRTFDGVNLRTEFAEFDGKTWVRLNARYEAPAEPLSPEDAAKLKSAEDAANEAKEINARVAGWAYRLPDYKLEQIRRKLDDLLEPVAKAP